MEAPGYLYAYSVSEGDHFTSHYEYSYFDGYESFQEANGVLVESAVATEARLWRDDDDTVDDEDNAFDRMMRPSALDNDSSISLIEVTAVAQTVRFVMRCVGSGLVVEADTPSTRVDQGSSVITSDSDDAEVDAKTDECETALEGQVETVGEDVLQGGGRVDSQPSSFKLFARSVGRPTQEWTMVSIAPQGSFRGHGGRGCDATGSNTSPTSTVQFINMATMQRLVCVFDPDATSFWTVKLMTPHEYRAAKRAVAGFVCADAAWTLSSDGNILSSTSGLALTDDGNGNLIVSPPSSHSLRVEQQWQLIPIV